MDRNFRFPLSIILIWLVFLQLLFLKIDGRKHAHIEEYMEIEHAASETPPGAAKLKAAIAWNYELRWNDMMQWDVQHSRCWNSGDISKYFNSSIHNKWEICRLTATFLNTKLPTFKHHFKTGTCCYIKCALHWYGWVNDDYSYNEARGENISKDLFQGLPTFFFTKLLTEYRKCSKLYKHPLDEECFDNKEFARCHIQAFNTVCEIQLDSRRPYPRPQPEWMKLEHRSRFVRKATLSEEEEDDEEEVDDGQLTQNTDPDMLTQMEDGSLIQIQMEPQLQYQLQPQPQPPLRSKRQVQLQSHSQLNHQISKRHTRSHWLTTVHFCEDLCKSACSINENLYIDNI